jgi:hypothetical protein
MKKLTKMNLDQLAKEMPVIPEIERNRIIGGNSDTTNVGIVTGNIVPSDSTAVDVPINIDGTLNWGVKKDEKGVSGSIGVGISGSNWNVNISGSTNYDPKKDKFSGSIGVSGSITF